MDLRKDPITRSWCITGDDVPEFAAPVESCRFCLENSVTKVVSTVAIGDGAPWSAEAVVHPNPLYHVEGDPDRRGEGLYDRMAPVGAHEVLLENRHHDRNLWQASDAEVEAFLRLVAGRIQDLKQDQRFKYVSIFKNYGASAGQEFDHPNSQLTATTFVPRRVLYELRSGREYFKQKERCVFCDILAQEERQHSRVIEARGDFVSFCPYASRAPYETWVLPRTHDSSFERTGLAKPGALADLASLLRRTLLRIRSISEEFHMVLHTSPNTRHSSQSLQYWKTLDDDYHWHIEILPVLTAKSKSYTFKEVYYSPVAPETAVLRLREAKLDV